MVSGIQNSWSFKYSEEHMLEIFSFRIDISHHRRTFVFCIDSSKQIQYCFFKRTKCVHFSSFSFCFNSNENDRIVAMGYTALNNKFNTDITECFFSSLFRLSLLPLNSVNFYVLLHECRFISWHSFWTTCSSLSAFISCSSVYFSKLWFFCFCYFYLVFSKIVTVMMILSKQNQMKSSESVINLINLCRQSRLPNRWKGKLWISMILS